MPAATVLKTVESLSYAWTFPGAPIRIYLDASVIDRIRSGLSATCGGLLLGTAEGGCVHIVDFRAVAGMDVEAIGAAIAALNNDSPEVRATGYFRTTGASSLELEPLDRNLTERYFRDPSSVVLLIGKRNDDSATASFFFWSEEAMLGDFALLEFPFDSRLLTLGRGPRVAKEIQPVRKLPRAQKVSGGSPVTRWPAIGAAGVLAAMLIMGLLMIWQFRRGRPAAMVTQEEASKARAGIGLTLESSGQDFHVLWDRTSADVGSAKSGLLVIQDGGRRIEVPLTPGQLRAGSVLYRPVSGRINVDLSLTARDGKTRAESILALLPDSPGAARETRAGQGGKGETSRPLVVRTLNALSAKNPGAGKQDEEGSTPGLQKVMTEPVTGESPRQGLEPAPVPSEPLPAPKPVAAAELQGQALADTIRMPIAPLSLPTGQPGTAAVPLPEASRERPAQQAEGVAYRPPVAVRQAVPPLTAELRPMVFREIVVPVQVKVSKQGMVIAAMAAPQRGVNQRLIETAIEAARRWRFRPALMGGQPVETQWVIEFRYKR